MERGSRLIRPHWVPSLRSALSATQTTFDDQSLTYEGATTMRPDAAFLKTVRPGGTTQGRFSRELFKTLVHYICWLCDDPRLLTQQKLNFILWYADRHLYFETGQSITGATYIKHQNGPRARAMAAVLDELQHEGGLVRRPASSWTEEQLFFALRRPALDAFNAAQISLIDAMTRGICHGEPLSAINQQAHDTVFRIAQLGEILPLFTVFAGRAGEIGPQEINWALRSMRAPDKPVVGADAGPVANGYRGAAIEGLFWHLNRDPAIGISVPGTELSWFIYKQAGFAPLAVPEITLLYRFDLGELIIGAMRCGEAELADDQNPE